MATTHLERQKRVAVERIVGFAKQFDQVHLNLACHAAFPLVLTPDLLYQIWAHFVPEAPWSGVARVLLSRLCRQVGYEMYEMDIAVRNLLLRELKEQFGQERLDELAEFLIDYVAQQLTEDDADTQDLREAQEWTALAYTKPDEAARELALALSEKVKQEDMGEVLRLTSFVDTLAEPLVEGGFEPLLVYSRGMKSFVRGDINSAEGQLSKVLKSREQLRIVDVILDIPSQVFSSNDPNQGRNYCCLEGGSVPLDDPAYIVREADERLYHCIQLEKSSKRILWLLAPRQAGKSSLMRRVENELVKDGEICCYIDLTGFGSPSLSESSYYFSFLYSIINKTNQFYKKDKDLYDKLKEVWKSNAQISVQKKFYDFFVDQLLTKSPSRKLAIFIDGIECIINCDFKKDFIKVLSVIASQNYPQLSKAFFVLSGYCKITDIIDIDSPTFRTFINLQETIKLDNFTQSECQPLIERLKKFTVNSTKVLETILYWTGGQPYLTQALCHLVCVDQKIAYSSNTQAYLEKLVNDNFIINANAEYNGIYSQHFPFIKKWLADNKYNAETLKTLNLYKKIFLGKNIKIDKLSNEQLNLLQILGLVTEKGNFLKVANPIYERVFNLEWIEQQEMKLQIPDNISQENS